MMTREQRAKLETTPLLWFGWWGRDKRYGGRRRSFTAYHRVANAAFIRIGRVVVNWRMPWLEHSARALHPELFD